MEKKVLYMYLLPGPAVDRTSDVRMAGKGKKKNGVLKKGGALHKMAGCEYFCMYSKQLQKKNPTWIDGFAVVQTTRLRLLDENHRFLCEAAFDSREERIILNGEYVVQLLEQVVSQIAPAAFPGGTTSFRFSQPAEPKKRRVSGLSKRTPELGTNFQIGLPIRAVSSLHFGSEEVSGAPAFRTSGPFAADALSACLPQAQPHYLVGNSSRIESSHLPKQAGPDPAHAALHFTGEFQVDQLSGLVRGGTAPRRDLHSAAAACRATVSQPVIVVSRETHFGDEVTATIDCSESDDWWLFGNAPPQHPQSNDSEAHNSVNSSSSSAFNAMQHPRAACSMPDAPAFATSGQSSHWHVTAPLAMATPCRSDLPTHHSAKDAMSISGATIRRMPANNHCVLSTAVGGNEGVAVPAPSSIPPTILPSHIGASGDTGREVSDIRPWQPSISLPLSAPSKFRGTLQQIRQACALTSASGGIVPGPTACLPLLADIGRQACPQCGDQSASLPTTSTVTPIPALSRPRLHAHHLPQSGALQCAACFWRRVPLSTQYPSPTAYTANMIRSLTQEAMFLLGGAFAPYWRVASAQAVVPAAPDRSGGVGQSTTQPARGLPHFQRQCRDLHVPFYASCELVRLTKKAVAGEGKPGRGGKAATTRFDRDEHDGDDDDDDGVSGSHRRKKRQRQRFGAKKKEADGDDADFSSAKDGPSHQAGPPAAAPAPRFFLRFAKADRERSGAYSRDDLWVISTSPLFGCDVPADWHWPLADMALPPCVPTSSSRGSGSDFFAPSPASAPLVWMGRSAFHGPSSSDMIELLPIAPQLMAASQQQHHQLSRGLRAGAGEVPLALDDGFIQSIGAPPALQAFGMARSIRVCALRGPSLSTEAAALDLLSIMHNQPSQYALLPALASPATSRHDSANNGPPSFAISAACCVAAVETIASEFKLNADQKSVLQAVARRLSHPADDGLSPFVLCHGVFGSGKSHTLVALVMLLSRLLDAAEGREPLELSTAASDQAAPPRDTISAAAGSLKRPIIDLSDSESSKSDDEDNDGECLERLDSGLSSNSICASSSSESDESEKCHPKPQPQTARRRAALNKAVGAAAQPATASSCAFRQLPRCRVLIAASTNAAVDRVLLGLREAAFGDFARVGSARKTATRILPHFLPYDDNNEARQAALIDMRATLADPTTDSDDKVVVAEAARKLQDDADHVRHLSSSRVFGVTCAATAFPCLARLGGFEIVILDEASQMVEQVSLLSIARFGARVVVCAGDPQQLPPVISRPPVDRDGFANSRSSSSSTSSSGLGATPDLARLSLFVRLSQAGVPTIILRTQYRCHPVLSQLCSRLFYANQIVDGVAPWQRGPRIRGLAPLVMYDYSCCSSAEQRVHGPSGSLYNTFEAKLVTKLIAALLSRGQAPSSIGVICLYKAQVYEVQRSLAATLAYSAPGEHGAAAALDAASVQVNTVDAFQGNERPIIIVCCSRTTTGAALSGGLGGGRTGEMSTALLPRFIDDSARLNVALSRAQHHLLITGHARGLSSSPLWASIIACARELPGGLRAVPMLSADIDLLAAPPAQPAPRTTPR